MIYLLNTTLLNLISDSLLPRQSKPKFHVSFCMAYLSSLSNSIPDGSTCSTSGQVAPAVDGLVYTLPKTLTLVSVQGQLTEGQNTQGIWEIEI